MVMESSIWKVIFCSSNEVITYSIYFEYQSKKQSEESLFNIAFPAECIIAYKLSSFFTESISWIVVLLQELMIAKSIHIY